MVFYFSGTGNSEFVAQTLANFLSMDLCFIPEVDPMSLTIPLEDILFVFPVYSWGIPPLIEKFIKDINLSYWDRVDSNGFSVNCVMVCGDEVALAPEMFRKVCKKCGFSVASIWSVIMPNNYVLLPGFNVDPKDLEQKKLEDCKGRILEIAQSINAGTKRIDVVRGSMPWIKTKLVYPLFKKWGIFPQKWHYLNNCISCGKCASICPLCNVKMQDKHPQWGRRCCSCLACYHICPVHAVAYGTVTLKKGQYFFPLRKILSRRCHK